MKQSKRRRSHLRQIILIILCIELLMLSGILVYVRLAPPTVDTEDSAVYHDDLTVNGRMLTAKRKVEDTIIPKATGKNLTIWKGEIPKAVDFIHDIEGDSKVTVSFEQQPDFTKIGTQTIHLILSDSSGNQTRLSVTVTVKEDKEPPVISGAKDLVVTIGDSISYKKGITVTDNKDKKLSFSVNNSEVNLKKAGSYTVTYTAEDTAGNQAKRTIQVEVKEAQITEEQLFKQCDKVLDKILKTDMTKREEAYAIYRWIKKNIGYSGTSDKSDWITEAYRGLTEYTGDCFTYYAVAQALLTRAEIDNMCVTRVGGRTKHYWNLVNCGDGWYHYDSCPNKDHKETFMMTDKEAKEYTNIRGNNYYTFDKSLYPATPEE